MHLLQDILLFSLSLSLIWCVFGALVYLRCWGVVGVRFWYVDGPQQTAGGAAALYVPPVHLRLAILCAVPTTLPSHSGPRHTAVPSVAIGPRVLQDEGASRTPPTSWALRPIKKTTRVEELELASKAHRVHTVR